MKGLGKAILFVGVCWAVFALNMDVSVSTGSGGRVNNLGLMADRQIHTILGGIIALAGLLMILLVGRTTAALIETDSRPCPLCAEPIKNAAIKCKHCGSDVEAAPIHSVSSKYPPNFDGAESKPLYGWTVRIPDVGPRAEDVTDLLKKIDLPLMTTDGGTIVTGPYENEKAAKAVVIRLGDIHNIQSNMYWVPPAS